VTTLADVLQAQDGVVSRGQALEFLTPSELRHRLAGRWQIIVPGVYAGFTGQLGARQRLRAALLHGGPTAMLNDRTTLELLGVRYLPREGDVHVLIAQQHGAKSRAFIRVRRTHRHPHAATVNGLPSTPAARALVEFGLRWRDQRAVRAVFADAVQRGVATQALLSHEIEHVPALGSSRVRRVFADLGIGVQSAPELDFLALVQSSRVLPQPYVNPLLELPCGRRVSPDTLFLDAGLVHETNGRLAHASLDDFEDMQERHDGMTAAGLVVLHNPPARINRKRDRVLAEVETCYLRNAGRGLPPGVVMLRASPP
jgi:hypothetical protein